MTSLMAVEYPETPVEIGAKTTSFDCVKALISLYDNKHFKGSIVAINTQELKSQNIKNICKEDFFVIPRKSVSSNDLINSCVSQGHLSIVFFPMNFRKFIKKYMNQGFYSHKGSLVDLASKEKSNPLSPPQRIVFIKLFSKLSNQKKCQGCAFSHDASHFYCISGFRYFKGDNGG